MLESDCSKNFSCLYISTRLHRSSEITLGRRWRLLIFLQIFLTEEKEQFPAGNCGRHGGTSSLGGTPLNIMSRNSLSDLRSPATGCTLGTSGHSYTAIYFPVPESPLYNETPAVGYITASMLMLATQEEGGWFILELKCNQSWIITKTYDFSL